MLTLINRKHNSGFTLAELLIVLSIIGILVAVSIPIFTGQIRKAKVATNKANIRAARAAGIAKFYDDETAGKFSITGPYRVHAYYYYDTASGRITGELITTENIWDYKKNDDTQNSHGAYSTANSYGVCSYILIYVSPTNTETGAALQTAPYYTETSGDKPAYNSKSNNYFGPDPGK